MLFESPGEYSPGVSAEVNSSGQVVYSKPNNDTYSHPSAQPNKISIRQIQTALVKAGYNIGPTGVDGKKGRYTLAAIEQFKKNNNLPDNDTAVRTIVQPVTPLSEISAIKKLSGL